MASVAVASGGYAYVSRHSVAVARNWDDIVWRIPSWRFHRKVQWPSIVLLTRIHFNSYRKADLQRVLDELTRIERNAYRVLAARR